MQRGERIRRDFGPGLGNGREQRGFARVRITDEADFGDDAKFQKVFAFHARLARLRETRRLAARRREITVAQTAAPAFAQDKLLAVFREVGDEFAFLQILGSGYSANGSFLAQINFHRRFTLRTAEHRTFARAAAEHRPGAGNFVLVVVLVVNFFFNRSHAARPEPDQRAAGNLDD